MVEDQDGWTEEDSEQFRQLAAVAVPARDLQIAQLLTLLPFGRDEGFHVVELGSGEGLLAAALLMAFPEATLTALDGSESMRARAAARLARFGERASVAAFELGSVDWRGELDGTDVVWASLTVHHLDAEGKQRLFRDTARRTSDRGVLLLADVVEPASAGARELFAGLYDHTAETQSVEQTGSREAYEAFVREGWNIYRHSEEGETPSPLFDQLRWLQQAGFAAVEVFWLHAGHALYGGAKTPDARPLAARLSFADALTVARDAWS